MVQLTVINYNLLFDRLSSSLLYLFPVSRISPFAAFSIIPERHSSWCPGSDLEETSRNKGSGWPKVRTVKASDWREAEYSSLGQGFFLGDSSILTHLCLIVTSV